MALGGQYAALWRAQTENAGASVSASAPPAEPAVEPAVSQEIRMLTMYMEGCGEREIAEQLGTPERRVRRLLERMRALVEHRGFPGLFRSLGGSKVRAAFAAVPTPEPPAAPKKPKSLAGQPVQVSVYGLQLTN
jgi:hypothetical protein